MKLFGKRPGLFKNNLRFYVLLLAVVLSIGMLAAVRLNVVTDMLFRIRLQQVYGFAAMGFWYLALLATPLSVIFGKGGFMQQYLYARRALGVSAAYFALLHMLISLFGQLGGVDAALQLQGRFQVALWFGLFGLITLIIMALTSFDKVISFLGFARWKWIHRVGYIAGVLVYLHVWMIGTHIDNVLVQCVLFVLLSLLALLESWRVTVLLARRDDFSDTTMRSVVFVSLVLVFVGGVLITPRYIANYHSQHQAGSEH